MATEVSSILRDSEPYNCIGLIEVTFPDDAVFMGTCTLVGRNDILTAGHVVYSPDHGGWAKDVEFFFGADFNNITNELEDPGYYYVPTDWNALCWPDSLYTDSDNQTMIMSEAQYDVAMIGINDPIGDTIGWLELNTISSYSNTSGNAVGYPFDSTGMMHEIVSVHANDSNLIYKSNYDVMGPGSSGGPLIVDNTVIGVKSTSSWWADVTFLYNSLADYIVEDNELITSVISGTWADDNLWGTTDDDEIDGGLGIDTVNFTGNRSQYILSNTDFGYMVEDNSFEKRDGADTISNVEILQFADCTVDLTMGYKVSTISSADLKTLEELYAGFFNRIPEAAGLSYWIDAIDSGVSLKSVADQFYSAGVQYGVYSATMSETEFIETVYANVLGRSGTTKPDSDEISYWQTWLSSSANSQGAMVLEMIKVSHQQYTDDPEVGWVVDLLNNKAEVANYFAVQQGLSYNDVQTNITQGVAIAAAITPTDTAAAIALIGVNDDFSMLSEV